MKVLLDECLPRRLAREFVGHEAKTLPQVGRAAIKNGRLLRLAEGNFDVFVTVDRNLSFQQNLNDAKIAVLVLGSKSNRYQDLLPLMPWILDALGEIRQGQVMVIMR